MVTILEYSDPLEPFPSVCCHVTTKRRTMPFAVQVTSPAVALVARASAFVGATGVTVR